MGADYVDTSIFIDGQGVICPNNVREPVQSNLSKFCRHFVGVKLIGSDSTPCSS